MTAITTITTEMPALIAGQLADGGYKDVDSCHNEDTGSILPGQFIVVGTTDTDFGAKNPSAQNQLLKGVAIFGQSYQPITELDTNGGYLPNITFDYLRHGRVAAIAKAAMTTSSWRARSGRRRHVRARRAIPFGPTPTRARRSTARASARSSRVATRRRRPSSRST